MGFDTEFKNKIKRKNLSKNLQEKTSISINSRDSMQDVLENLCSMFEINLIIEGDLSKKTIIYSAQNESIYKIIKSICKSLQIKCEIFDNNVTIKSNKNYIKNYQISCLSSKTQNTIENSATNMNISSGKNESKNSSFLSKNISTSESNFWEEIKSSIQFIVNQKDSVIAHPQSGIITVNASYTDHQNIKKYIKKVKNSIYKQIYVYVKIIEISLNKENSSGINWNVFKNGLSYILNKKIKSLLNSEGNADQGGGNQSNNIIQFKTEQLSDFEIFRCLKKYGNVNISSGLIFRLINNHVAKFESCDQEVYMPYILTETSRKKSILGSEVNIIPIGLMLQIKACNDIKTGKTLLHISFKYSKKKKDYEYTIRYNESNADGKIPVVSDISMDTTIIVEPGTTIIIGGLNKRSKNKSSKKWIINKENQNNIDEEEVLIMLDVKLDNEADFTKINTSKKAAIKKNTSKKTTLLKKQ